MSFKTSQFFKYQEKNYRGGWVALSFRKNLHIERKSTLKLKSFEHLDISISRLLVYRPPPSKKNQLTLPMFYDEFSRLIEPNPLASYYWRFSFSRRWLWAMRFPDLLDSAYLVQLGAYPPSRTHTQEMKILSGMLTTSRYILRSPGTSMQDQVQSKTCAYF